MMPQFANGRKPRVRQQLQSATMRLPPALREFPRAWGKVPLHSAASNSSPLPSLTGFSSLSSLYLPLVSFPAHANPTILIHFLLTKTRFY